MNNRGMTLVELLISISLISVIIVFLFGLLGDLSTETDNNDYAFKNQINRSEILYTVEEDLLKNELTNFSYNNGIYTFTFGSKTSTLRVDRTSDVNYVYYTDINGTLNKWKVKDAKIGECDSLLVKTASKSNYFYFKLIIPIYTENVKNVKDNNNSVDDLEFTYSGVARKLKAGSSSEYDMIYKGNLDINNTCINN